MARSFRNLAELSDECRQTLQEFDQVVTVRQLSFDLHCWLCAEQVLPDRNSANEKKAALCA
jgi:hypothetical protein